ncbi:MAG: hypothetical protein AB8F74_18960 [Saprospiraceae bacterium]
MNFKEKISNFILGNISISQLPEIGLIGLKENLESESLIILAGMSGDDNSFELEEYYKKALIELDFQEPSKLDAAKNLIVFYLKKMISNSDEAFKLMSKIDNEIYKQLDWKLLLNKETKYVGEEIGLEKLFTWYREIQDWRDGSRLLYYNELPRDEQRVRFEKHLIEESNNLLDKLEKEKNTKR